MLLSYLHSQQALQPAKDRVDPAKTGCIRAFTPQSCLHLKQSFMSAKVADAMHDDTCNAGVIKAVLQKGLYLLRGAPCLTRSRKSGLASHLLTTCQFLS